MTNTELTGIREEKNLGKSDFAKLLGITPMLLGRYEKGSCAIPDSIVEKLQSLADAATATEIEVKKTVRKGGRKAKEAIEEAAALTKEAVENTVAAEENDVTKAVKKAVRTVKESAEKIAQGDAAAAAEAEVKKNTRKASGKARETAAKTADDVKKATGFPNIIIQSPMGGSVTPEDIAKKVPKGTENVYVRIDENKLYYLLENGETGALYIWE